MLWGCRLVMLGGILVATGAWAGSTAMLQIQHPQSIGLQSFWVPPSTQPGWRQKLSAVSLS